MSQPVNPFYRHQYTTLANPYAKHNKAIPLSPAILERVVVAWHLSPAPSQNTGADDEINRAIQIIVPWDEFVFSTHKDANGNYVSYLSPAFQKGLDLLRPVYPDGVPLKVVKSSYGNPFFSPSRWLIGLPCSFMQESLDISSVEHEVTHFVQYVGDIVLNVGLGFIEPDNALDPETQRLNAQKYYGTTEPLPHHLTLYGLGKKKKRSFKEQIEIKSKYPSASIEEAEALHGALEIEFHTNARSVANEVLRYLKNYNSNYNSELFFGPSDVQFVLALICKFAKKQISLMHPVNQKAFLRLSYRIAAEKIREKSIDFPLYVSHTDLASCVKPYDAVAEREQRREQRLRSIGGIEAELYPAAQEVAEKTINRFGYPDTSSDLNTVIDRIANETQSQIWAAWRKVEDFGESFDKSRPLLTRMTHEQHKAFLNHVYRIVAKTRNTGIEVYGEDEETGEKWMSGTFLPSRAPDALWEPYLPKK